MGWELPVALGVAGAGAWLAWHSAAGRPVASAVGAGGRSAALAPPAGAHARLAARPFLLVGYRSGGGRPKSIERYATRAALRGAFEAQIQDEDDADRYVYRMAHAATPAELAALEGTALSRSAYAELAARQRAQAARLGREARR